MAYNAARIADYNPRLDSGIIGGMSMAGITPDDPIMELVNERAQLATPKPHQTGDAGVFGEWVANPFKGLVRGVFMGLEGLMQEAESAFVRTPVGMMQGKSFGEAFGDAGRSDAFHALNSALSGKRVHAGTGYFATDQTDDDAYIQQELKKGRTLADVTAGQEYKTQFGVDVAQMGEEQRSRLQLTHSSGKKTSVSLGRLAAIQVAEPGTQAFHMMSGLIDATKQIALDPADLALGGFGKAMKLRKAFSSLDEIGEATMATKALRRGLLGGGGDSRKTFFARDWDTYADSKTGQNLMNWIGTSKAERGNAGLREMYEVFGATQKGQMDPNLLRALHDTEDVGEIRDLLRNAVDSGQVKNTFGTTMGFDRFKGNQWTFNAKRSLDDTPLGRLGSVTNSKVLNIADGSSSISEFDNYTKSLGLNQGMRDDLLEEAIRIYDPENGIKLYKGQMDPMQAKDAYSQYFGLVKKATDTWVEDVLGLTDEVEHPVKVAMERIFKDEKEFRSFWVDNMGKDVMFGGARFTTDLDGKKLAQPSPLLMSQFLDQAIPLMDPGAIRSAMNKSFVGNTLLGPVNKRASEAWLRKTFGDADWEKFGHSTITNMGDFLVGKVWKPSVLLRVAWPVRVIGEEQLRLSGKLMAGAFNHPLQYFALTGANKFKTLNKFARMGNDAMGENIMHSNQYEAAMNARKANISEALTGKKAAGADSFRYIAKPTSTMTNDEFLQSFVYELHQLEADPIARQVAAGVNTGYAGSGEWDMSYLDDVKEWFWKGDGQHLREQMLRDNGAWDRLNSKAFAQSYIDTVYSKLHQLGGGDGHLLNEYTKSWSNFSGSELDARGVREMYGGNMSAMSPQIDPKDIDPLNPFQPLQQEMSRVFDGDELRENLVDLEQLWDDAHMETGDMTEATDRMIDAANHMIDDAAGEGAANAGKAEYIPTHEAQQGVGRLAENRSAFNKMYQTEGTKELSPQHIEAQLRDAMNDAMMDDSGARIAGDTTVLEIPEMQNIESASVVLNTYTDDVTQLEVKTFMHVQKGQSTALIEAYVDETGKMVGVKLAAGTDGNDMRKLMKELLDKNELNLEEMLDFTAGEKSFLEWLNIKRDKAGFEPIHSEGDLWRMMDEDPALMKDYYSEYNTRGIGNKGQNPRQGPTSTTLHGADFTRGAMNEARKRSRGWDQHTEWFKMEKPGDPRIFELVGSGGITDNAGKQVLDWGGSRSAAPMRDNKEIKKAFESRMAYFGGDTVDEWRGMAPNHLRQIQTSNDAKDIGAMDKSVDFMMNLLMSKPTDALSRSPAFRQFYWARASEMAQYLDDTERAKFLESAEKANLLQSKDDLLKLGSPMRTLRRYTGRENTVDEAIRRVGALSKKAKVTEAGSVTSLAQLDELAKGYALQEVKALMYDQSRSHNWADMMRFVIPFGEAWWEVGSTWAGLLKENPRNIRRIQQGISGARGSDPFRDVGPDGEQGRGFFYNDPTTGDEVFAFPDPSIIPSWMPIVGDAGKVGDQLNLTGRVAGLNLMANVLPGIGPAIQIPMSQMSWANDIDKRWLRDLLMPFGKSTVEGGDASSWLDPVVPAWFQKALQSFGAGDESSRRLQANTTIDVYKTLLMQGWSDDNPTEMKRTLEEAKRIAQSVTRIRALASFAAPTGASQNWEVAYSPKDETGDVWAYSNLATAYRQLLDENNGDEVKTYKNFSDLFGVDPMLFAVSKTQKVLPRAVTIGARKWEQDNSDLFESDKFELTAYYARPDDTDGEFDYETYLQQIRDESRQPVTPEQWALKRNQFVGRVAYSNFQRQADRRFQDAGQRTVWLQNTNSALRELFPGYGENIVGLPAKPSLGDSRTGQLGELYRWAGEERLAKSEVGQLLDTYLKRRNAVVRLTQQEYGYTTETGFRTGVKAAINRRQLRELGQRLAAENAAFIPLWQQILSRELEEPEATMQPVNLGGVTF